uniref:AlNc14C19G1952 protein n=1 Tax=Albugo laibachii Nc14 TaxID=890382 RepID=F0W4Y1_9STRA|nr:AlNc14C19G1952 [Albugo laibachii Nc14]|eukprot:CCA16171.1 AlNc14C19G1952 [Albugo laibachii Nc14]
MKGESWKDMLVSLHSFIHRMSPTRVECDAKLWRECNYDVISVLTFSREARWVCTEMSLQQFSECDQAIPYRGGRKRYSAALRLIGQALKKLEHKRYIPVVFICTDGKKGERFTALDGFAENFRKRHSDGLRVFEVVGYGDMHLSFLMDFASRLGALCTTKI